MDEHHLDLAHEFPAYSDKIHYLKVSDNRFKNLLHKYSDLNQSIKRAEQRIDLLSAEAEEALRKQRLVIKDELYAMLVKHY